VQELRIVIREHGFIREGPVRVGETPAGSGLRPRFYGLDSGVWRYNNVVGSIH
jgi:hypothetical protein